MALVLPLRRLRQQLLQALAALLLLLLLVLPGAVHTAATPHARRLLAWACTSRCRADAASRRAAP